MKSGHPIFHKQYWSSCNSLWKGFRPLILSGNSHHPVLPPLSPGKRLVLFFSGKSYQSLIFLERGLPFFFSGMSYHPIMYLLERDWPYFSLKELSSYYVRVSPGKRLTLFFSGKSYHPRMYLKGKGSPNRSLDRVITVWFTSWVLTLYPC